MRPTLPGLKLAFGILLFAGAARSVAQPLVANAGLSTTICSGATAAVGGSPSASYGSAPYTYSWAPATGLSSPTISNPTASPGSTVTYTLTVTDNLAAVATSTVTVTVNPSPAVSANSPMLCAGQSASLVAAGATTYSWSPGTYLSSTTTSSPTCVTPSSTITYTVTGVTGGCSATAVSVVTVNAMPIPNAGADQTACNGSAVNFSPSGGGGTTYLWTFGDGGSATTLNPSYTYAAPGVYTATLTSTSAAGCTGSDNMVITVNVTPSVSNTVTNVSCFGLCDGSIVASASGGPAPFSFTWAPAGSVSSLASSLCAGIYTVTVTNANGCSATQTSVVNEPPAFMADGGPDQNICTSFATLLQATPTGGTAPYTYNWTDGTSNYAVQDYLATPVVNTSYTLTVTDGNGCAASDIALVTVNPETDFYGHVSYSGGSLSSGTNQVVLYGFVAATSTFDTAMVTTTDAAGNFHFAAVVYNNYIVKAFNDAVAYPLLIPTYYGGAYVWDSAAVRMHDCTATDTTDIVMIEVPLMSGPGHVDGTVLEGAGFARIPGDPVPGVDIKLGRNPGGELVAQGTTNGSGGYSFDNIPVNLSGENYRLYVDIPGLDRISTYDFVISGTGITQYYDLDFEADSNTVYTTQTAVGMLTPASKENTFAVYPNPAKENVSVMYSIANDAKISLAVYNMLGLEVAAPFSNKQAAEGSYNYTINAANYNLKPGVYFISLTVDGKTVVQRAVITD